MAEMLSDQGEELTHGLSGMPMKALLLGTSAVMCVFLCSPWTILGDVPDAPPDTAQWTIYRNEEYGYEIKYPSGLEFSLTGAEGERDGREFVISLGTVYGTRLHCTLYPGLPAEAVFRDWWQLTAGMVPGLAGIIWNSDKDSLGWRYELSKQTVGGKEAIVEEASWLPSGGLTGRSLIFDGVVFVYAPEGFGAEADSPMGWPTVREMISSFRFLHQAESGTSD
jgi:hypothetical protein